MSVSPGLCRDRLSFWSPRCRPFDESLNGLMPTQSRELANTSAHSEVEDTFLTEHSLKSRDNYLGQEQINRSLNNRSIISSK